MMSSRISNNDTEIHLRRKRDRHPNLTFPSVAEKPKSKVTPNTSMLPSNHISDEVNKVYLEYLSAEKYIRDFLTEREFYQVVGDRKKLSRAINSIHATSSNLLEISLPTFAQLNIDHRLWKVSVYQIVHVGRLASSSNPSLKSEIQKVVTFFLEKGLKYLESLRDSILAKCPFTRNPFHGGAEYSAKNSLDAAAAKVCHSRILLCIGDTHRYGNALKLAYDAYEEARSVDPGNGAAYHQLGLMALIQRDFLSAVYDFLRAASSPVPLDGAKQQLQIAFDEALKSYNRSAASYWYRMGKEAKAEGGEGVAKEVWVTQGHRHLTLPPLPDGVETKAEHWAKLSTQELTHRFCLTFVLVIGKLWTNVGMETVHVVAEECLVYFAGLLYHRATFHPLRILHVVSLLMLLLDELRRTHNHSSVVWITAIQFSLEVFSIMSNRLSKLVDLCDWDSSQLDTLSIGLSTWVTWMEQHEQDWKGRRPRPLFSINHLESFKEDVLLDRLDSTWQSFARVMTRLTLIFRRFSNHLFPSVQVANSDGRHRVTLSPFPEAKHLYGLTPVRHSYLFHHQHYCDSNLRASRGRNMIRLNSIFRFGLLCLYEKLSILELHLSDTGLEEFVSRIKVKSPYSESEVGGLDRSHHQYWIRRTSTSTPKNRLMSTKSLERCGDVNRACSIIVKKSISENFTESKPTTSSKPRPKKLKPFQDTFDLWETFTREGFCTDIVIHPQNFVLDTNCFVRRLSMIKVLTALASRPLFIPVSVILELKGLSKGGLRKKDQVRYGSDMRNTEAQQKLIDGMELGARCLEALSFITENMPYFQVITSTGTFLKIKTPHAFIKDDHFDPSDNNDDRILQSCRKLEELDLDLRQKDSTRRLYRKTILLTGDRCLRLKSNLCYYIPARGITPVVFWLISQLSISFYLKTTRTVTELRDKRNQKRKEKREKTKALRNASSPRPTTLAPEPEHKVRAILHNPNNFLAGRKEN